MNRLPDLVTPLRVVQVALQTVFLVWFLLIASAVVIVDSGVSLLFSSQKSPLFNSQWTSALLTMFQEWLKVDIERIIENGLLSVTVRKWWRLTRIKVEDRDCQHNIRYFQHLHSIYRNIATPQLYSIHLSLSLISAFYNLIYGTPFVCIFKLTISPRFAIPYSAKWRLCFKIMSKEVIFRLRIKRGFKNIIITNNSHEPMLIKSHQSFIQIRLIICQI